jgi:hypothetical protein
MTDDAPGTSAPMPLAEAAELVFLAPAALHFSRHGATLRLVIDDDRCVLQASVLRAFPLTEPRRYLSVRDGGGKEVGVLVEPAALAADDRAIVEAELERRYLVPIVQRVIGIKERFGTVDWQVETDRGRCTFTTRNLRENVTRPAPGRVILSDVDGNRYDVPDLELLDAASRDALLKHL